MYKHIDLFCGAGGIGLGFEKAGFDTVLGVDLFEDAINTYNLNLKSKVGVVGKIENFPFPVVDVDIVTGGFPCQPFSVLGNRKGFDDERSQFYESLLNVFCFYTPKFIVLENVKEFVHHNKGKSLTTVIRDLENLGYSVKYKVMNSWNYSVPQKRERVIIVAHLPEYDFEYPKPTNDKLTLKDCILDCDDETGYKWTPYKMGIYKYIKEGGDLRDLPDDERVKYIGKSKDKSGRGYYKRLAMDKPCSTLTANPNTKMTSKCHPTELRPLSIQEYQVIQSFPKDYKFCGSISSQYKQIGNAVSVNMAYYVGISVIKSLNNKENK